MINFKKLKILSLLCIPLFLNSCGFSKVSQSSKTNFSISDIKITGERKIGNIIKNELVLYSESSSKNLISLNLSINKQKNIKEKDTRDKVTKYQITIQTDVTASNLKSGENKIYNYSATSFFNVDKKYSKTLKEEENLIKNLSEKISKEIFRDLSAAYF